VTKTKPRRQCKHCPWKKGSDTSKIPGYRRAKHCKLSSTVDKGITDIARTLRIMACHKSKTGADIPCVGWMVNQLGPGNNLALRMAVISGRVDAHVVTVGPQHRTLQETLKS
jgi:hypothetical protein